MIDRIADEQRKHEWGVIMAGGAVLTVSGIKWSDLGEPKRVIASIQTVGARPLWLEKY